MKIKEINISGIGCIHNLHLEFNDKMNIICGPNGIGKTTIIESVASMFMFGKPTIKRNVTDTKGSIHARVDVNGSIIEKAIEIKSFIPNESDSACSFSDCASKIISIKVGRNFDFDAFLRSIKQNLDGSFAGKELIAILKTIPYQMYI